jgi:hypothetical protein
MSNRKIIITVPHAICFSGSTRLERNCDVSALSFANVFSELLLSNGYDVTLIKPDLNRKYLDPNRFSTMSKEYGTLTLKDSALWQKLNDKISTYKNVNGKNDVIVFDIHSFPREAFSIDGLETNVVILDNYPYQEIVKNLNTFLNVNRQNIYENENDRMSKILTAKIGSNAIIDVLTSGPVYIKALLIEINEKLSLDALKKIAELFVMFLKTYDENKYRDEYLKNKSAYTNLKNIG